MQRLLELHEKEPTSIDDSTKKDLIKKIDGRVSCILDEFLDQDLPNDAVKMNNFKVSGPRNSGK